MVMFKARFHAPEPVPGSSDEPPKPDDQPRPTAPPIEEEDGPQAPVKLPGPGGAPARAHAVLLNRV